MKTRITLGILLLGLTATLGAQSTTSYGAKKITVSVRTLGGSYTVKMPAADKKKTIKANKEHVEWTINNVPTKGSVRIDWKKAGAPTAACFAVSSTSWQCTSSTPISRDELNLTTGQQAVAKIAPRNESFEYDLVLTAADGKEYKADPFIIVER